MLPIGTEVMLKEDILEETDRKSLLITLEKLIKQKISGKVKCYEKNGQLWVDFPGRCLLLWPHELSQL